MSLYRVIVPYKWKINSLHASYTSCIQAVCDDADREINLAAELSSRSFKSVPVLIATQ